MLTTSVARLSKIEQFISPAKFLGSLAKRGDFSPFSPFLSQSQNCAVLERLASPSYLSGLHPFDCFPAPRRVSLAVHALGQA